ncbi:MAG: hypothetical protein H7251_18870, partial [Acetobacteraceae bacterium]|nr:hypothetical protein [Acetobacteraceae bacterium]
TQPFIMLDEFLLSDDAQQDHLLSNSNFGFDAQLDSIGPALLCEWADRNPEERYTLLGQHLGMFRQENHQETNILSPVFLGVLNNAPDKRRFLSGTLGLLHPNGCSGSLSDVLTQRRAELMQLAEHADAGVRQWFVDLLPNLDAWIASEQSQDRESEGSFE